MPPPKPQRFDHENLDVYQEAVRFVALSNDILVQIPKGLSVRDQLDRASTAIPLNIAEGNGKFTARDRCRFWDIARGSALECSACLDVAVARGLLEEDGIQYARHSLFKIVSMLVGLIRTVSADRVAEGEGWYGKGCGDEGE